MSINNFWIVSKTIKLSPHESRKLIRALRIKDEAAIIAIVGASGWLPGWWGKIMPLILGLGIVKLNKIADSIEKDLRRSPHLGVSIKAGLKPHYVNPFYKFDMEAKPRGK